MIAPAAARLRCWSRPANCAGFCATASRLFLMIGVPLIAFVVLGLTFSSARDPRAQYRGGRCRPYADLPRYAAGGRSRARASR